METDFSNSPITKRHAASSAAHLTKGISAVASMTISALDSMSPAFVLALESTSKLVPVLTSASVFAFASVSTEDVPLRAQSMIFGLAGSSSSLLFFMRCRCLTSLTD